MKLTKEQLINEIIRNSVYQPDSGLVQIVKKGLQKLSTVQLANLLTLINCK